MGCSDKRNYGGGFDFEQVNSENENNDIVFPQPGPCPEDPYGVPDCPPPTELVCIKTDKVYESCKELQGQEQVVDLHCQVQGAIYEVESLEPELVVDDAHPFICEIIAGTTRVRVSFYYRFRFRWIDDHGPHIFVSEPVFVEKTAIMSNLARDPRIQPQCEVFLKVTDVFVSNLTQVTVCICKLLIFKLFAHVQLLIPAYGFCPPPPDCPEVLEECPECFIPPEDWPPHYPPQPVPEPDPYQDNVQQTSWRRGGKRR